MNNIMLMPTCSISSLTDICKVSVWDNGALQEGGLFKMPRGGLRLRTADGKMNAVGPRVRDRRHKLGVEQDELCARIARITNGGWNPAWQDMSRVENGFRTVTDLEVNALAQALECSPCWLLVGETEGR